MKKKILLALALFFVVSLAACSEKPSPQADNPNEKYTDKYKITEQSLPESISLLTTQAVGEDIVVLGGMDYRSFPVVGTLKSENNFEPFTLPDQIEYIYSLCIYGDNIAVLSGSYPHFWESSQGAEVNDAESYRLSLLVYSMKGELLEEYSLFGNELGSGDHFFSLCCCNDAFYVLSKKMLIQLSKDGEVVDTLSLADGEFVSQCVFNGRLVFAAAAMPAGGGVVSSSVNVLNEAASLRFTPLIEYGQAGVSGLGIDKTGKLLINLDGELYRAEPETQQLNKLVDLSYLGVLYPNYRFVNETSRGFTLFSPGQEAITYAAPETEGTTKTRLLIWSRAESPTLKAMISQFNRTNREYVAELQIISMENEDQLKAEIISGKGPDIFSFGMGKFLQGIKDENFLEDLSPYIARISQGRTNILVPGLLNAVSEGDKIYRLPVEFALWTFTAPRSIGVAPGASMEEVRAAAEKNGSDLPLLQPELSRASLWHWACNLGIASFVDTESASCSFDSPEYVSLLKTFKEAVPENEGEIGGESLLRFEQVATFLRLHYFSATYGENYIYIGCPAGIGSNGSAFSVESAMAISASSLNKEGAWKFLETSLSTKLPLETYFPASAERMEMYLEQAMNGDLTQKGLKVQICRYDVDQLYNTCSRTTALLDKYPFVMDVMKEEAAKYFAGQISAEEAAQATQSRAGIYLAEQYG